MGRAVVRPSAQNPRRVLDTVIARRYRLLGMLGQGGMGSVWRAQHTELLTQVAVKLMDPAIAQNAKSAARFKREAQAAASLFSITKHVVHVLDYGVDDGLPFIAMELLEGEDLCKRLARVKRLTPTELVALLGQVGKAIAQAHRLGIVHRDLKPANVFIARDQDSDEELVKVLDFGVPKTQRLSDAASLLQTGTGELMGTPLYMSPEQISGKAPVDARTDVWALAVIAFEALTGKQPFIAETFTELERAICTNPLPIASASEPVPEGFDEWFAQAAARDLYHRFESVEAALISLRQVCGSPPGQLSGAARSPAAATAGDPGAEVVVTQGSATTSRGAMVEPARERPGSVEAPEYSTRKRVPQEPRVAPQPPDGEAMPADRQPKPPITHAASSVSVGPELPARMRLPWRALVATAVGVGGLIIALVIVFKAPSELRPEFGTSPDSADPFASSGIAANAEMVPARPAPGLPPRAEAKPAEALQAERGQLSEPANRVDGPRRRGIAAPTGNDRRSETKLHNAELDSKRRDALKRLGVPSTVVTATAASETKKPEEELEREELANKRREALKKLGVSGNP